MMAKLEASGPVTLPGLLQGIAVSRLMPEVHIRGLSLDSRETIAGDLFLAIKGRHTSGVKFIREAINSGAVAVVVEQGSDAAVFERSVPVVAVPALEQQAGVIASRFYGDPSACMNVIGITGTNGKTSIAHFISQALGRYRGKPVGMIGTLGNGLVGNLVAGTNTTPDPVSLQKMLADMVARGASDVAIEVTSIGLDQSRINGTTFDTAVFTNLSPDHLDYHPDMHAYGKAKKRLFTDYGARQAVVNLDDALGDSLYRELTGRLDVYGYGLCAEGELAGRENSGNVFAAVTHGSEGMELKIVSPWGNGELRVPVWGRYNASNLLASIAALCVSGVSFAETVSLLSGLEPVPGRMEMISADSGPRVYVDYAHTPDALEKVLQVMGELPHDRLVCVFGCGGDRDTSKRPRMGAAAEQYSDLVIVTDDNPRNEDPARIVQDILSGVRDKAAVRVEHDRRRAIGLAIESAGPGDIILIAGKGHETYQDREGHRYPFSDQQTVRELLGGTG